jgi:type I restriction enzyme S subunit
MSEWKKVKLGELYEVHNGLSKGWQFFGSGYPFLTFSDVFNNWFLPDTLDSLVQSSNKERVACSIKKGDVFITRTSETMDELGMSSVALKDYPNATYNGFTKRLRPITGEVVPEYIGYYLRSKKFRAKFMAFSSMTTRASLANDDLLGMEVEIPDKTIQIRIATILSRYDTLIENYQKQIKLLEEAAQRLYKEWFVELRFPGHENTKMVDGLPEGWERKKLVDMVDVQYGYAFDGMLFNSDGDGMPILRIRNIPDGTTSDFTTEEAPANYIVRNGDIVVGMDGIFHINSWSGGDAYLVQRACSFRPKEEGIKGFIFQAIQEPIKFFEKTLVGATVAHLGKKHIDSIELVVPNNHEFFEAFQTMYIKRQGLLSQIRLLTEARDRLLPRLMGGKMEMKIQIK